MYRIDKDLALGVVTRVTVTSNAPTLISVGLALMSVWKVNIGRAVMIAPLIVSLYRHGGPLDLIMEIMINCLQINLNRSRSAQDLLMQHILELNIDLCAIMEPSWIGNSQEWFSSNDGNALIFAKTNLKSRITSRRSIVAVTCQGFTLISAYVSPNLTLPLFISFLEEIKSLIIQVRSPIILCGDFNAHSSFWGSTRDNRRGTLLLDYMAEFDLRLVNSGSAFTCSRAQGNSIIDLTWASAGLMSSIEDWRVNESLASLSDHLYISFSVHSGISSSVTNRGKSIRWNIKKMVEEDFITSMEWSMCTHSERLYRGGSTDYANWIVQVTCDALDFFTPRISNNVKKSRTYWWSDEIHQFRRRAIAARRIWCRCRRRLKDDNDPHYPSVYDSYKKAKRNLKNLIKKAKGVAWGELIASINDDPWGLPFKLVLSKIRRAGPGITEKLPKKTLDLLLRDLFPKGNLLKPINWPHNVWNPDYKVEYTEVYNSIRACKKANSAPGPDGIKYTVWRKLHGIAIHNLAECFTLCLKEGIYPDPWKVADLILIPKSEHTDLNPKVRPICLLDTIGKLFEKIISSRLTEWLSGHSGSSLSERQYGFRKQRSAIDALLDVRKVISSATNEGNLVLAISLDISNAFNSIPLFKIRRALFKKRAPDYLRRIVSSYLTDRKVRYRDFHGNWSYMNVTAGVPQGSVLGPLLWNIAYDSILRTLLQGKNEIFCFADDTLVLLVAENMDFLNEYVATDLRQILKSIGDLGLKLSDHKTNIMLFGGRNKELPTLKVGRSHIEAKRHMKYLGWIVNGILQGILSMSGIRQLR